jgi:hypothetical protein
VQCPNCEYALWNLPSRVCPECGRPFKPSEFEFIPNTVQFCCPHCSQPYYGQGKTGHLVPSQFDCVKCGAPIQMDEMVLRPHGDPDSRTQPEKAPWFRADRGFFSRWLGTVGWSLGKPGRLMRYAPLHGTASAVGFAAINTVLVPLLAVTFLIALILFFAGALGGFSAFGLGGLGAVILGFVIISVIAAFAQMCLLLLCAAWAHGVLHVTGDTRAGFPRTLQAICFSTGANIVSIAPCIGTYGGWIWWLVSAVLMVREGQRVSAWRAVFAVVPMPVLAVMGLFALMVMPVWSASTTVSITPPAAASAGARTQTILDALLQHANAQNGSGPRHAVELIQAGALQGGDFIEWSAIASRPSPTTLPTEQVGSVPLFAFEDYPATSRRRAVGEAIAALPSGSSAHRLGAFVFTYHGADLSRPGSQALWVVVHVGDPGASPAQVQIGTADGIVQEIAVEELDQALQEQNALRALLGLPPLPDPREVP